MAAGNANSLHNLPDLRRMASVTPPGALAVAVHGERLKLHAQAPSPLNAVTGYGPGYIEVNRARHGGSLILAPEGPVQAWAAQDVARLASEDFHAVLSLEPELVLIGTGTSQRFPRGEALAAFARAGVGYEVMDTAAACRTFNILVAEGRRVVCALLAVANATEEQGVGHG
jgi:uncharacterized protein